MKIAIVGSRTFPSKNAVVRFVNSLPEDTIVISGGAKGVDTWAVEAAEARGLKTVIYPANWKAYGKSAGYRRNITIVDECDELVAFHSDGSKGTQHGIDLARKQGKLRAVYTPVYDFERL